MALTFAGLQGLMARLTGGATMQAIRANVVKIEIPGLIAKCLTFESLTLDRFLAQMRTGEQRVTALGEMLDLYDFERTFPDLGNFRLGPNMFDKTELDWILLIDESSTGGESRLLAHGVATRIQWDGTVPGLPIGWQGAVRHSYSDLVAAPRTVNTLVGLFINVDKKFRQQGWAACIVQQMKSIARLRRLDHLIIPLRLPSHYSREHANLPIAQLASMRRPDGEYVDYWLRLHARLGARILATCDTSHQHAMNLDDFRSQFGARIEGTGYHLVDKSGQWYRVYVDIERDFALINQGCVWVEHCRSTEAG